MPVNPSVYFELAILKMCNQIQDEKIVHIETVKVPQQQVVETPVNPEVIEDEEIIDEPVQDIGEDVMEEEPYIHQEVIEEVPTFEFEKEPDIQADVDNDIHVDEADIMNILVQAKRTILESIQERWPIIKRYLANLNMAKSAGMLCDGTAVAACEGGLIISFEYQPSVNAVNYYKNYKQLSAFLQEVLGSEYRFIAIQQDEWIKMRSHFIELKRQGQLPEPHELTLKHIDCHDLDHVDMTEAQEFAVQLFGEDIVEFKED